MAIPTPLYPKIEVAKDATTLADAELTRVLPMSMVISNLRGLFRSLATNLSVLPLLRRSSSILASLNENNAVSDIEKKADKNSNRLKTIK